VKPLGRAVPLGFAAALTAGARPAIAQPAQPPSPVPVAFSADQVRFDARSGGLAVTGHVHVDEPPFFFVSDALELRRVAIGVELRGRGTIGFCPCLGTPLAVSFTGATVAPPHDVIVRNPVLEVFGLPIAWLPIAWLRSAGRVGLLPPDVAWRGGDGFFAGGGVHLPWTQGDVVRGLDLRAGGYANGGAAVDVALRTPESASRVRWDRLRGNDGVTLESRGTVSIGGAASGSGAVWQLDALRGGRALAATTEIEAASRGVDRAQATAAWRFDGWTLASGVRDVAVRGGLPLELGVGGPFVALRRAESIGDVGSYDASLLAGETGGGGLGATTFARADGNALVGARLGIVGASFAVRGVADVSRSPLDPGPAWGAAAQARAVLALPLEGAYASGDDADPWIHRTEPRLELAALASRLAADAALPAGPGMAVAGGAGRAWVAAVGWSNALGRWGTHAAGEVDVSGGIVGTASHVVPALRARAAAGGEWLALRGNFARLFGDAERGGALLASIRIGPADGAGVGAHVAERDGLDPLLARALVDPSLEPSGAFLDAPGWTGGAHVGVPLGSRVTVRGGAEADLTARELLAVGGSIDVHDPCGCVALRANASERVGRPGVDVWLSVTLHGSIAR
jgi:hypothetical protein